MNDAPRDASLQSELVQLRAALSEVQAPAPDEAALCARFRDAQRVRAQRAEHAGGSWRLPLAAAAAVVLVVGGVLTTVMLRSEPSAPMTAVVEAPAVAPSAVSAFQPLSSSPGLTSSSYSVVRVRIPLSAFAVVPGTQQDGSIEADLLVGEDGLARAIRFNQADALLLSVADQ